MSTEVAPLGPVDVAIVAFPEGKISDQVTQAMVEAVASGAVRLLDALIVEKSADGEVTVIDIEEEGQTLDVLPFPAGEPGLLTAADATELAEEIEPGATALMIAWENMWVIRMRRAIDEAGGVVALHERIDTQAVLAAFETIEIVEGS
jgi:hypothetical protein